jgi:hypothetical protein
MLTTTDTLHAAVTVMTTTMLFVRMQLKFVMVLMITALAELMKVLILMAMDSLLVVAIATTTMRTLTRRHLKSVQTSPMITVQVL